MSWISENKFESHIIIYLVPYICYPRHNVYILLCKSPSNGKNVIFLGIKGAHK